MSMEEEGLARDTESRPSTPAGWIDSGQVIDRLEDLEAIGTPVAVVRDKVLAAIHEVHRRWLQATSLVFVSTASAEGRCDVSPKGDPPGFVQVLDDHTIALPERPGNRRMDGFHNILTNPHAGLICVIPGRPDTLRINGRATLVRDAPFMDAMEVLGHRPAVALVVEVEEVFFHCPKAFRRGAVWDPGSWMPGAAPPPADIALALWRKGQPREEVTAYYERPTSRADLYTEA